MLVGHQKQWQLLKKSAEAGKIPHAFLFCGPEQIGKKTLALELIKLINCKAQPFNNRPCQTCRSCQDIEKKQHPDLAIIEPDGREIKIAQIRDLHARLSLRSYSAPFKTAILDEAHKLSQEAQSAFLKLLEEPKGQTLFVLITEYPAMLLSTILSRTQTLKFYPVPEGEIREYLEGQKTPGEKIKEISRFSFGGPGRAVNFLKDSLALERQKKIESQILRLGQSDLVFRFQYVKDLAEDHQNLKETLDVLFRYFRNILIAEVKTRQGNYSLAKLKNILKSIQNTNFLISTTNVNPRLALEMLMLEL